MNRKEYRKQLFQRVVVPGLITCVLFVITIATGFSTTMMVATTAVLGVAFTNLFIVDGSEKTDD